MQAEGGAGPRTLTALRPSSSPSGRRRTGLLEESVAAETDMPAYLISPGVAAVELIHSRGRSLFLPD